MKAFEFLQGILDKRKCESISLHEETSIAKVLSIPKGHVNLSAQNWTLQLLEGISHSHNTLLAYTTLCGNTEKIWYGLPNISNGKHRVKVGPPPIFSQARTSNTALNTPNLTCGIRCVGHLFEAPHETLE